MDVGGTIIIDDATANGNNRSASTTRTLIGANVAEGLPSSGSGMMAALGLVPLHSLPSPTSPRGGGEGGGGEGGGGEAKGE